MSFDRQALPEPESHFENAGLILQGRGTWRSAQRINLIRETYP